jgi:hypothetical protein
MNYDYRSYEVDADAFKPAVTAQELRLGNWLYSYVIFSFDDGQPAKKGCISPFQVDLKTLQMIYEQPLLVTMEPIPLTPELLNKIGFENDFSTFEYADGWNNGKLFITDINGTYVAEFGNGNKNIPTDLKYLHALQNLIFSLTGQELDVNF